MVATEAHAIVGGTPSTDPSVVALVRGEGAATELVCSGIAIQLHAVLTAAHCLANGTLPDVLVGGERRRPVARFIAPGFDATTLENDVAILVFDQPLVAAPPTPIELAPPIVGEMIQLVGYGRTAPDDTSPFVLRTGAATIVESSPAGIVSRGPAFTCEGDSGGPALLGDRIVGVTSSGDVGCAEHSRHVRIADHAAWIDAVVAATLPSVGKVGDRCWYTENCELLDCRPALDDPRLSFCTMDCTGDDCPGDLVCLQGSCHHRSPSPGALTSRCTIDEDCADELCLAPAGDDDTRCTRRCFSDLPGFECPSGTACEPASDDGEACFRAAEGGCCSGAPQPSILLALFVLLARRPRPGRQLLRGRGRP